jgi:hypothetical protein
MVATPPDGSPRGNPGGPGNPFARRTAALRQALAESVTPGEMRALGRALFLRALEGDHASAKLFLAHAVGRAAPAADPDTLDRHEMGVLAAGPEMLRLLTEAAQALLPEALCGLARAVLPPITVARAQEMARKLGPDPESGAAARPKRDGGPTTPPAGGEDSDGGEEDDDEEWDGDDPDMTPEWAACLASVAPPPEAEAPPPPVAALAAAPRSNGRPAKSTNGANGTPRGTAWHAPAPPNGSAKPRRGVPNGKPPTVTKRGAKSSPRGRGAGPKPRPPRPGRHASAKRRKPRST